ncbi:hypothetical protein EDD36DRAFT_443787 [Exophiala viscosa]|uniref:Uncharacterized protein n=1 Tax=Exophiala viscosa TaxID=2486360 RepID=A0AAN6DPQ2_9EURO|nr:hypothetical protein EDD36DRAFT_443787 [Exophiala viscosa]
MEHFAPHPNVTFEGYYSKFILPSGSSLCLIVCSVHNAESRPHMVSFTYVPVNKDHKIYQRELFPPKGSLTFEAGKDRQSFFLDVKGIGSVKVSPDSTTTYDFSCPEFTFKGITTPNSRVPWSSSTQTPESWLVYLPLPLHWHVHSFASKCEFEMKLAQNSHSNLDERDEKGVATVHQEKNWASSFPSAHIWIQAYPPASDEDEEPWHGFNCAGGQILGMEAYLLGYRNKKAGVEIDFRPPFAVKVLGMSPFLSVKADWASRSFTMSVQDLRQKLDVHAYVERDDWDTFFGLSAPFPDGHRKNFLGESLQAKLDVSVYTRGWIGGMWEKVLDDHFDGAALEFGAGYYPPKGEGADD